MKRRTKIVLSIVLFILFLLFLGGKDSLGLLIGLAAAIGLLNWAFDQFMPKFATKQKKKMLKKFF